MDGLTRRIAEYAHALKFADIPADVISFAKTCLIDTLGCALGGKDCEAVAIARRLATGSAPAHYAGRILGTHERANAEEAAFINTSMIRYLDFNDAIHGGHPSDMVGALLALAEAVNADGELLLSSIVVAYEVSLRMVQATELREKGWDQGFAIGIGTAAGVGHLLGLPAERIAHAISITCVANVPMRASRAGRLSHWKGSATAFSTRNALYATLLAAEGMTSPDKPFEGRHGLWEQVTGPFELLPWASEGGRWLLMATKLKYWPVEGNTLTAVWAALDLRKKMPLEKIAAINIDTHWSAWHETASEAEKWNPTSRETADHSMPYIFARTFLDGTVTVKSFEPDLIADPRVHPLMQKIKVHNSEEVEKLYKSTYPFTYFLRVKVTDVDGQQTTIEIKNPRGTAQNPMTDGEVDAKFRNLAEPAIGKQRATEAVTIWRKIETAPSVSPALDAIANE